MSASDLASAAGNTVGGASDVPGGAKGKRRAGIPDFDNFGYTVGSGSGEEASGDMGMGALRPGTSGSREIEWVDWLEEYKKMKEAKLRAEKEARQQRASQTEDIAEEGEFGEEGDVPTEMDTKITAGTHSRKRSDDGPTLSQDAPRRGSDDASANKG